MHTGLQTDGRTDTQTLDRVADSNIQIYMFKYMPMESRIEG